MLRDDPTLTEVSLHHQRGLARAAALARAAHEGPRARRQAAQAFLGYFAREALPHCRDEERLLFPLIVAHHSSTDAVTLSLAEHEWLQVLVRRLGVAAETGTPDPELLETIAGLLVRHIAREERELMPVVRSVSAVAADDSSSGGPRERLRVPTIVQERRLPVVTRHQPLGSCTAGR